MKCTVCAAVDPRQVQEPPEAWRPLTDVLGDELAIWGAAADACLYQCQRCKEVRRWRWDHHEMMASVGDVPSEVLQLFHRNATITDYLRAADGELSEVVDVHRFASGYLEHLAQTPQHDVDELLLLADRPSLGPRGFALLTHLIADEIWRAPAAPVEETAWMSATHDELVDSLYRNLEERTSFAPDVAVLRVQSFEPVLRGFEPAGILHGTNGAVRRRALDGLLRIAQLLCSASPARQTHLWMPADEWRRLFEVTCRVGRLRWCVREIGAALEAEPTDLARLERVAEVSRNTADDGHPMSPEQSQAFELARERLDALAKGRPFLDPMHTLVSAFARQLGASSRRDLEIVWP